MKRQRRGDCLNELDTVRFLAAEALCASARRPIRGYATGGSPALVPHRQVGLLVCPHVGRAVCFVNLPSCRAGTYFRCAAKVSKGAPKGGKTTVRSCFLSSLWNPFYLSTARGPPPRGKRAGAYVCESVKVIPAQLGQVNVESPRPHEPRCVIDSVSPRRIYARRRTAFGRKIEGIPKGGKKTAPNGCLSSLWCAFGNFRRKTKVTARRVVES